MSLPPRKYLFFLHFSGGKPTYHAANAKSDDSEAIDIYGDIKSSSSSLSLDSAASSSKTVTVSLDSGIDDLEIAPSTTVVKTVSIGKAVLPKARADNGPILSLIHI